MRRAALCLAALVIAACAPLGPNTGRQQVDDILSGNDRPRCKNDGRVTLLVENRNPGDVQTSLRRYVFQGLKTDSIVVDRYSLSRPIYLRIVRGGMNRSGTPPVDTENVSCDHATLIIGDPLSQSYFFGADVLRRRP